MKKREPEDEQLCIAVHTSIHSIITPRHMKINQLDRTALHNRNNSKKMLGTSKAKSVPVILVNTWKTSGLGNHYWPPNFLKLSTILESMMQAWIDMGMRLRLYSNPKHQLILMHLCKELMSK